MNQSTERLLELGLVKESARIEAERASSRVKSLFIDITHRHADLVKEHRRLENKYRDTTLYAKNESARADLILNTANTNTWAYNSDRLKGGSYGVFDLTTGLFSVTDWRYTINQLIEEIGKEEVENILTASNRLTQAQDISVPSWFSDTQKYNFDSAYEYSKQKDSSNVIHHTHDKFGDMRGIVFGAKALFRIPKNTIQSYK